MKKFNLGDVVVFDPSSFNPEFWNNLSEADRIKAYGPLGYVPAGSDNKHLKVFVFITEINQSPGHCVLVDMDTGKVEWMRHTDDFRLVSEDEI